MTLTELSYKFRKILPFFILFCLLVMIIYYATKLFFVFLESNQPKTVYTNPIFGNITKPIVNQATNSADFNFTLDTIEGIPITATESAKVFFIPPAAPRFGYREKIYLLAKNLGFDTTNVKYSLINNKLAVFEDSERKLTVDIATFNFSFEYKISNNYVFVNAAIPAKKEIENKAIDFIKQLGRYPDELAQGKTNTIYLNYNPQQNSLFVPTLSNEANVVEVDFYRPDIDKFPVVSPKYFNSQNFVIMVFTADGYKVLKAQIQFYEKSADQYGIYPIKTGDVAWEELKAGKGIVVAQNNSNDIAIKEMFLGYLDTDTYQDYLQPVYVFLGKDNFVAYVTAVTNNYFTE